MDTNLEQVDSSLEQTADMVVPRIEADVLRPDALANARMDFVERCLIKAQDPRGMIDLKASSLLSAVALTTAALGIVATNALDVKIEDALRTVLKVAGMLSFLA